MSIPRPQPTHIIDREGDEHVSWEQWKKRPVTPGGRRAHAIAFDDGTVFDLCNGWRERTPNGWRRMIDPRIDGTGWAEAAFSDDVDPAQRPLSAEWWLTKRVPRSHYMAW